MQMTTFNLNWKFILSAQAHSLYQHRFFTLTLGHLPRRAIYSVLQAAKQIPCWNQQQVPCSGETQQHFQSTWLQ